MAKPKYKNPPQKWIHVPGERVALWNDSHNVFYIREDLEDCPSEVIEAVVAIFNSDIEGHQIGSGGLIDQFLLESAKCTQEHREFIVEEIYANYYKKYLGVAS